MSNLQEHISQDLIADRIIILRNKKVLLDRDLAGLYHVPTKRLNEQVKRNITRFPTDFMFQLTHEEKQELIHKSPQFENLKFSPGLPFAFTEHGAVMLAGILNSEIAVAVNIQIVRVFISLRTFLSEAKDIRQELERINTRLNDNDDKLDLIFKYLDELINKNESAGPRKRIGYKPDEV
jgi:hypothetical protein